MLLALGQTKGVRTHTAGKLQVATVTDYDTPLITIVLMPCRSSGWMGKPKGVHAHTSGGRGGGCCMLPYSSDK